MMISQSTLLEELIQKLIDDPVYQLKKPSIVGESVTLYMQRPPALEQATRKNLSLPLSALIRSGEIMTVTDPMLSDVSLSIQLDLFE